MIGSIQTTKGDYFIMPKVTYTSTKGLIQEAGSGIAISGNELVGNLVKVIATTSTLTLSDSGCVLIPITSTQTFTLPAVATAAGFHVTFRAGHASAHVIAGTGFAGAYYHNSNASTFARVAIGANKVSLTLTNPLVGDYLTITGDGTSYHVFGWTNNVITQGT